MRGPRPQAMLGSMRMATGILAVVLVLVAVTSDPGAADEVAATPWKVGAAVSPFTLEDQHGEEGGVDASTRLVLFTADMDATKLVRTALEQKPALQDLAARDAVSVSDIHRMPSVITTLFALPAMRRRPWRMLLDRGPGPTVDIPREEGHVTAVALDDLTVRSIEFLDSPDEVARVLAPPPAQGGD